jgi:hypothetical protein
MKSSLLPLVCLLLVGCGSPSVEQGASREMSALLEYRSGYQAGQPVQLSLKVLNGGTLQARVQLSGGRTLELAGTLDGRAGFFRLRASQGPAELLGHFVKDGGSFSLVSEQGFTVGHLESQERVGKTVQLDVSQLNLTVAGKSAAEPVPILANLALANQILNDNLSQQTEIGNQQAMNQIGSSTLSKVFLLVEEELDPLRVGLDVHLVQSKQTAGGAVSHSVWEPGPTTQTSISQLSGDFRNLSFRFVVDGLVSAAFAGNDAVGTVRVAGQFSQTQP